MIWVLFEGAGSPRLNKVARQIMFTYCPFPEEICSTLAQNPIYSELLDRRKIKVAQGLHHLDVLTRKLQNGNIPVPETVEQERYYISGSKNLNSDSKRIRHLACRILFYVLYLCSHITIMHQPAVCPVPCMHSIRPHPEFHGRSVLRRLTPLLPLLPCGWSSLSSTHRLPIRKNRTAQSFFPEAKPSTSHTKGSISASSSTSAPMAGHPRANLGAAFSASISAPVTNTTSASFPASRIPSPMLPPLPGYCRPVSKILHKSYPFHFPPFSALFVPFMLLYFRRSL